MTINEAIAVHLYLDNNTESWVEPGKSAKKKLLAEFDPHKDLNP